MSIYPYSDDFYFNCQHYRIKPETVIDALTLLHSLGRVSAFDFSKAYWPHKLKPSHRAGLMFLKKLYALGLLSVFIRNQDKQVFEINDKGLSLIGKNTGDSVRHSASAPVAVERDGSTGQGVNQTPKQQCKNHSVNELFCCCDDCTSYSIPPLYSVQYFELVL